MNIKTISVSVNYLDLLSYTWSFNQSEIADYTIITDPHDSNTLDFCQKHQIKSFVTNAFYQNGSKFNKAQALNEYFTNLDLDSTEWLLLLDSDIVINNVLSSFQNHYKNQTIDTIIVPNDITVGNGIPVYVGPKNNQKAKPKLIYPNNSNAHSSVHGSNDIPVEECLFSCHREIYKSKFDYINKVFEYEKCFFYGYFHLFHVDCIKDKILNKQPVFMSFDTAAVYDMIFAREYWAFPQKKTMNLAVHHLGPVGSNWEGRKSETWS